MASVASDPVVTLQAETGSGSRFWRMLLTSPAGVIGLIIVLTLIVAAVFAPWIAPFDPLQMGAGRRLIPPDANHWFGTDEFGRDMFSRVVFGAEETHRRARAQLEQIMHPAIRKDIEAQLRGVNPSTHQYVLLDAAVMLEAGWSGVCDTLVFLDTPAAVRRERVAARGWAPSELDRREASQWPLDRKRQAANAVITNTGSLEDAGAALWRILQQVSQN